MSSLDHRLNRLLEATQRACPPLPEPSPWFEQRMMMALKAEANPFAGYLDGLVILRILGFAAVIMLISVMLPWAQPKNPYIETLNLANSTMQLAQMR